MKRIPYITLTLTLATVFIQYFGETSSSLQWDRNAIVGGEAWRIVTAHFVHWTRSHFIWDLTVFAILGTALESKNRKDFLLLLAATSFTSHIALARLSEYDHYRGLSAIDTALFTYGSFLVARYARDERKRLLNAATITALLGLAAKLLCEGTQKAPVFAGSLGPNISVATVTHITGFLSACAIYTFKRTESRLARTGSQKR